MTDSPYTPEELERILKRLDSLKEPVPLDRSQRLLVAVRWVIFLPTALCFAFVFHVILALLPDAIGFLDDDMLPLGVSGMKGAAVALLSLAVGLKIAPVKRGGVVVALALPLLALGAITGIVAYMRPHEGADMHLFTAVGWVLCAAIPLCAPGRFVRIFAGNTPRHP